MADSTLSALTAAIPPSTMAQLATRLGASEQAIARGFETSTATVVSALANRSADPGMMQQAIDAASHEEHFTDPASPLMSSARSFLSSLFGRNLNRSADSIAREAGLGAGAAATLMALAAHSLLRDMGARVREGRLSAATLGELLNREAPAMRELLPGTRVIDVNPVVAQGVTKERSLIPWIVAAVIASALAFGWFGWRNGVETTEPLPSRPIGTSGTITPPDLSRTMPNLTLALDVDRLRFDSGSSTLQRQSNEQLQSIAAILNAHSNVRATIGGYTDDVGSAAANMKLSEARAAHVRNELIGMGVDGDRLSAEGYGEASPIADNSTAAGRAMNRRISMQITEK